MSTFALLEHTAPGQPTHWDLLLDDGGAHMPTWRLGGDPSAEHHAGVSAERIADHRRVYLTFEGEIAGGRGRVRRVDEGGVVVEWLRGDDLRAVFSGRRLRGVLRISGGLLVRG